MLHNSLNSSGEDLNAPPGRSACRNLLTSTRSCILPRMYPRIESSSKLLFLTPADRPRKRLRVTTDQSACSSSTPSPSYIRMEMPSRQYWTDPRITSASGEFCGQQPGVMNLYFLWSPFVYRLRTRASFSAATRCVTRARPLPGAFTTWSSLSLSAAWNFEGRVLSFW